MNKSKGIGYLRYSDKRQDGNHSLEIQKNQIQLLAEKENIEIIKWREDKATSAFHGNAGKRKGLQKVFEDIEAGAEAICFYEESRITRSITDFYNDVYLPIKAKYPNTQFFNTQYKGEWNPNNPITQAKLVFAAEESEIKSTRAKDAQKILLNSNHPKRPGSRTPAGYDMEDGILHPNEDAIIIELIFYLASWGHSHRIIANYLNKCEIKTEKIKYWNSSTISYILNNKAYSGHLAWNVRTSYEISKPKLDENIELFKHIHESIVNPALIYLVHQVNDLKNKFGKMDTPYFLRGIITCKKCQFQLVAKDNSPKMKKGKYLIYRCNKCKKSISTLPVHHSVLNDLQKKWNTQLLNFVETAKVQLKKWIITLNKAKKKLSSQLEKTIYNEKFLTTEIAQIDHLADIFNDTKHYLQTEFSYLANTIDKIEKLLGDDYLFLLFKDLQYKSFQSFSNTELRTFILMFFDEITVDFEKNDNLEISYRLSPFISLENTTGYIIEKFLNHDDATG
ncbi:recombinase family protein [Bacillus sp. REN10]|uniref:recombinase family protein n=1 Tax=Bacillus sp. REN10 TaxID=2782541 RepID=UPI00193B029F|nr:recombinase family protein [Bacillus sp. REN10]